MRRAARLLSFTGSSGGGGSSAMQAAVLNLAGAAGGVGVAAVGSRPAAAMVAASAAAGGSDGSLPAASFGGVAPRRAFHHRQAPQPDWPGRACASHAGSASAGSTGQLGRRAGGRSVAAWAAAVQPAVEEGVGSDGEVQQGEPIWRELLPLLQQGAALPARLAAAQQQHAANGLEASALAELQVGFAAEAVALCRARLPPAAWDGWQVLQQPRRRRGRPRKAGGAAAGPAAAAAPMGLAAPAEQPGQASAEGREQQQQRRKRGRPRKYEAAALPLEVASFADAREETAGRRRRRAAPPRQRSAARAERAAAAALPAGAEPVRRRRGRPRKESAAAAALDQPVANLLQLPQQAEQAEASQGPLPVLPALEPPLVAPPLPQPFQLPVPNLGYTCMNVELQNAHGTRTNRSCRRRTFEAGGLPLVSALALDNCRDLLSIVEWNRAHGIHFFRVPSALFPWSDSYELEALPDYEEIAATLAAVGATARAAHQRLTCHPSHYVKLASRDEALVARSLAHLELNSRVFDLMGYAPSCTNKINIHVGGNYGSKRKSLSRFARAVERLSPACRTRLTVENDDRPTYYSIKDLLPLHAMAGVPLVFDYLHHALVPGGMSKRDALYAALATWPRGVRPVVHYSEPSENPALPRRAHSRMLTQPFDLHGREADVDVMLEAKGMERALLFWRDELQCGRKTATTSWPAGRL